MHFPRKTLLAAFLTGLCAVAVAQPYPSRPITIVVPFNVGSGIDILARLIGPKLGEQLGQPVIVDNRIGASGNIGSEFVARAAPNGYTLMVTINTFAMAPALYKDLRFDPATDFSPIAKIALASFGLYTNPTVLPAKDLKEMLTKVKAAPGKFNYASAGNGTPMHLMMEMLKQRLGLDIFRIPYKTAGAALTDIAGGQTHMMFSGVPSTMPFVKSGKLRPLAVTGPRRSPLMPQVPTFRENGIDFMDEADAWYAVMAPGKMPQDLVDRLNREVGAVMKSTEIRDALIKQGLTPVMSSPEELGALIRADLARWQQVVTLGHITADQ